jgi:hypothetical protein
MWGVLSLHPTKFKNFVDDIHDGLLSATFRGHVDLQYITFSHQGDVSIARWAFDYLPLI